MWYLGADEQADDQRNEAESENCTTGDQRDHEQKAAACPEAEFLPARKCGPGIDFMKAPRPRDDDEEGPEEEHGEASSGGC